MSLIEIMVSMVLLTVIMLGLFSAFYQTQRALKLSMSQTDVLEGGRTTLSLVVRELQELAASGQPDGVNLYVDTPAGAIELPLTGGAFQTNRMQKCFFLTRKNDGWTGYSYFVTVTNEGVGTLFRYSSNVVSDPTFSLGALFATGFAAGPTSNNVGRIAEGIVHFTVRAFDTNGLEYVKGNALLTTNIAGWDGGYAFYDQMLPAFLEVELGVVDAQVHRQYKVINSASANAGLEFLRNQAGKVYLFRQRIPIRNHHEP
jgi:hypothetical protein